MFLYLHTVTLDKLEVCLFHLESNKFKNSNKKIHCLVKQYEEKPDPNIELLPDSRLTLVILHLRKI